MTNAKLEMANGKRQTRRNYGHVVASAVWRGQKKLARKKKKKQQQQQPVGKIWQEIWVGANEIRKQPILGDPGAVSRGGTKELGQKSAAQQPPRLTAPVSLRMEATHSTRHIL